MNKREMRSPVRCRRRWSIPRFGGVAALLMAALPIAGAQTPAPVAITHITLIDTANGIAHPDMTVVSGGNRIVEVGKHDMVELRKGISVIDGRGKFLLPGLWDMHVHLFNNGDSAGTDNTEYFFPLLVANGIVGVRDMWTDPADIEVANRWNRDIDAGTLVGPRVTVSSRLVDGDPPTSPTALVVRTAEEGRTAVRALKASGAGFVKVVWNLSREAYFAIADEARRQGIAFAGHVPRVVDAGEASDAGQRTIEHMDGLTRACARQDDRSAFDADKCTALAERLKRNGTWLVPTAVLFQEIPGVDLDSRRRYAPPQLGPWPRTGPPSGLAVDVHRTMRRVGLFLAGTDISNGRPHIVPGFSLHDELTLLVERGHTTAEALQAATINPAKLMGKLDEFGTIEKNKRADLLLLDANPLEDIRNTSRISTVVLNGRWLDRTELNQLLTKAEAVARNITVRRATLSFNIRSPGAETALTGTWEVESRLAGFPNRVNVDLEVQGTNLTGTIRAGPQTFPIHEGSIRGTEMMFKVDNSAGDRTVTLTGVLNGDEIAFTRVVTVRPGGTPGGQGFFGVGGPRAFTAKRSAAM